MKKIPAVPAAIRLAAEMKIDISTIRGTGEYGAVISHDVAAAKDRRPKITPVAEAAAGYYGIDPMSAGTTNGKITKADVLKAAGAADTGAPAANSCGSAVQPEALSSWDEVPMSGMRNVIAENMLQSMNFQPQYTMCAELDTTGLFGFLSEAKTAFADLGGRKLTFTDLMVKITAAALMKHPRINSALVDGKIRRYRQADIGIAVALDDGLIVPVVRGAEKLSLSEINRRAQDLIVRARDNSLGTDEYRGSTFSISNLGNYPVDFSTPIINSPEGGILGISKTSKKAVVVDDEIVIRTMTGFSLTLDHRIIDGIEGAKFLATLEKLIANPMSVLIDF